MKINLVTGGSGFVGRYLIKNLLESGENVWVLLRPLEGNSSEQRAKELFFESFKKYPQKFKIIEGDIMMENLGIGETYLQELFKAEVFLWHLAANLSFLNKEKGNAIKTNCVGTINAVDLANKIASLYIHMSTAYVCGNTRAMFCEDDLDVGQKFRNHYESSKFEGEKYVKGGCDIHYIIFRPSIIIGDAYEGKAEGCTFGYYRFAYMFFIFKNWLVDKILKGSYLTRKVLFLLGSRYNKEDNILVVPWLILLYPSTGSVDMVHVDHVTESMVRSVSNPNSYGKTVHLTNSTPPSFKLGLSSVIDDLGYRKVKYIKVPPSIFIITLKVFYYLFFPIRTKIRSAMWYLPYITRKYRFSHQNNKLLGLREAPLITRDFLRKINIYAQKEIFNNPNIAKDS
jgi:nucleoside-diphosphate-sugar epimerase